MAGTAPRGAIVEPVVLLCATRYAIGRVGTGMSTIVARQVKANAAVIAAGDRGDAAAIKDEITRFCQQDPAAIERDTIAVDAREIAVAQRDWAASLAAIRNGEHEVGGW